MMLTLNLHSIKPRHRLISYSVDYSDRHFLLRYTTRQSQKKLMVSISKQHLMIIISLTNKSVLLTLHQCKCNVLSKGKEEA